MNKEQLMDALVDYYCQTPSASPARVPRIVHGADGALALQEIWTRKDSENLGIRTVAQWKVDDAGQLLCKAADWPEWIRLPPETFNLFDVQDVLQEELRRRWNRKRPDGRTWIEDLTDMAAGNTEDDMSLELRRGRVFLRWEGSEKSVELALSENGALFSRQFVGSDPDEPWGEVTDLPEVWADLEQCFH